MTIGVCFTKRATLSTKTNKVTMNKSIGINLLIAMTSVLANHSKLP